MSRETQIARSLREASGQILARAKKHREQFARELTQRFEEIDRTVSQLPAGLRRTHAAEMKQAARKQIHAALVESPEFRELQAELKLLNESAASRIANFTNPVKFLERSTLGSERRAAYERSLKGAPLARLITAAEKAKDDKDADLAAVISAELVERDRSDRGGIDLKQLAIAALPEHGPNMALFLGNAEKDLIDTEKELSFLTSDERHEGGTTHEKLARGLRERERLKLFPEPKTVERAPPGASPQQKIAAGLAAGESTA